MSDHEGVPSWEELCRAAQQKNESLLADNASMNERLEMAQRWEAHAKEQLDRLGRTHPSSHETYRALDYVKHEVEQLAAQAVAAGTDTGLAPALST